MILGKDRFTLIAENEDLLRSRLQNSGTSGPSICITPKKAESNKINMADVYCKNIDKFQ